MIITLVIISIISIIANIICAIVIRGMIMYKREEVGNSKPKQLSGREIEGIRRELVETGRQGLSYQGALSLVKTLQDIQFGLYDDVDPYVPEDIYENGT